MSNRPLAAPNRRFAAPSRENRHNPLAALGQLPIPQLLVAVTFFFAFQQIFGPIGVAIQLGCTGLLTLYLAIYQPRKLLSLFKWWPIMLLPLMAFASAAWSVAPNVSARYGMQLVLTAYIGLLAARSLTAKQFVAMLYCAIASVCVLSLFAGRYGSAQTGVVMIGLFGSKNEMAYAAQLLLTASLAVVIDRSQPNPLRLSTLPMFLLSIAVLVTGSAAGAVMTAIGGSAVILGMSTLHLFRPRGRLVVILAMLVMIPPFVLVRDQIVAQANVFVQDVLHRDTTLSGRTYLWARADELIRERPVIGHGYRAIFVGNTVEGQGILRWASQIDGRAFHFHSSYREVAVDLGFIGLFLFCSMLIATLFGLLRAVFLHPTAPYALLTSIFAVILAKTPAEVVIGTFGAGSYLLFGLTIFAFAKAEGNPQWQRRAYHTDGTPLNRRAERRIAFSPVRLARPVRPPR